MNTSSHLAKHLREVYFGGNWTTSNLKDQLNQITWQQATTKVFDLNTIATLTAHVTYYVVVVSKVLKGEALIGKDADSFEHPPILSQADWENWLEQLWKEANHFSDLIEQVPEELLWQDFTDPKYGVYYRNLQGVIEHIHYHLGQISLLRKILITLEKA